MSNMAKALEVDVGFITDIIEEHHQILRDVSLEIYNNPENSFQEFKAHDLICDTLSDAGFKIDRNYILQTGFRARYVGQHIGLLKSPSVCSNPLESLSNDKLVKSDILAGGDGISPILSPTSNVDLNIQELLSNESSSISETDEYPNIALICEYDSLPEIGHAMGHNLTSICSIAIAIALKNYFDKYMVNAKVTVIGTPGEDGGGGKIDMLNAGAFNDVTFAILPNPMNKNVCCPRNYARVSLVVQYKGKAAHASVSPWEGRNALDAAIACYNNISLLRQQLKPIWTVNGIITKGGVQANIIPDNSEMKFWLRAPTPKDLQLIQQRCIACVEAAAKATDCVVNYEFHEKRIQPLLHNQMLAQIYANSADDLGIVILTDPEEIHSQAGSTDMGNVSHFVPTLSPGFAIATEANKNTLQFRSACASDESHELTLRTATALCVTAIKAVTDTSALKSIMQHFISSKITTLDSRNRKISRSLSDLAKLDRKDGTASPFGFPKDQYTGEIQGGSLADLTLQLENL